MSAERPAANDLLSTTDGREWAEEFMRLFGNSRDKIDLGLMTTWFANAIETGRSAGYSEGLDDERI